MTKTQNPFIAAEWIRRAVNQDYIEDNLVEYDWFLAQDKALAARILELGKQRGSAFALYRQGADAMQKGNTCLLYTSGQPMITRFIPHVLDCPISQKCVNVRWL